MAIVWTVEEENRNNVRRVYIKRVEDNNEKTAWKRKIVFRNNETKEQIKEQIKQEFLKVKAEKQAILSIKSLTLTNADFTDFENEVNTP